MRQGLQGECGIGGWGEIGEDTGEPLEGRIQQDSINNPVIESVFRSIRLPRTIKLEGMWRVCREILVSSSLEGSGSPCISACGTRLPVVNLQGFK